MGNKRLEQVRKKFKHDNQKQLLLLDEALKKLIDLGIATTRDDKYTYSPAFEQTAQNIISSPPGRLRQIKLANEAGRKLIPQIIALATSKPSRRDIENIITAYVCLKVHIEQQKLEVDKKIIPDLTYAVWYLNDNNPTVQEVESWNLISQTK